MRHRCRWDIDESNKRLKGSPKRMFMSGILNTNNSYFKSYTSRALNQTQHLHLAVSSHLFIMSNYYIHSIYVFIQEIFIEHLIYPRDNERDWVYTGIGTENNPVPRKLIACSLIGKRSKTINVHLKVLGREKWQWRFGGCGLQKSHFKGVKFKLIPDRWIGINQGGGSTQGGRCSPCWGKLHLQKVVR